MQGQIYWQKQLSSLHKQTAIVKDSAVKADLLFGIGTLYEANKPDSAIYYYKIAGKLSDKLNYTIGKARFMACMIELMERNAKYPQALQYCFRAIELAKKSGKAKLLAAAYNNTAVIYDDLGNREKTLAYYQLAMEVYERQKNHADSANLATVYGNILSIYVSLERADIAHAYGIKALAMSRATGNNDALLVAYANMSSLLAKQNRNDTALLLAKQQYTLSKKINDKSLMLNALGSINDILLKTGYPAAVKTNAEEMARLAAEIVQVDGLASANLYLAKYYFELKDNTQAYIYAQKAQKILKENKLRNIGAYLLASDIALARGDRFAYKSERAIADSLRDLEVSNKVIKYNQELQVKYNLSKKQATIDGLTKEGEIQKLVLAQQKTMTGVLAGAALVLTIFGLLYFRYYREKNKLLQAQQELKQQRITELENLQQLVATETMLRSQEEERKRIAKDLHDGLGGILSGAKFSLSSMKQNFILTQENAMAFERTMEMLDQSITELRRVAHNMMPETLLKLSFDEALADYCRQISDSGALAVTYQSFGLSHARLDNTVKISVYRVVQELINNAIKHAFAKTAMVQLIIKDAEMSITVEDDGLGFDTSELKQTSGIGYKSLMSRLEFLKGKIEVESAGGKGTHVYIRLPL